MAMQEAGKMDNPLLAKLLEQLASFNRPAEPLSLEEKLMLH